MTDDEQEKKLLTPKTEIRTEPPCSPLADGPTGPHGRRWMETEWPYVEAIIGDLTDPIDAVKAQAAWEQLDAYAEAARYQFARKQEILDALRAELQAHPHEGSIESARDHIRRRHQALVDVHFYLDCFFMVQTMMRDFIKATNWTRCRSVYEKWELQLEDYATARHHLQHINERFAGGKHARRMDGTKVEDSTTPYVEILTVFPDDKLLFGSGESWDVSPKSLDTLQSAVAEFSQAAAEDARDWYVHERPYQTQRGIFAVTPKPRPLA